MPLGYEVFQGNRNDVKTWQQIVTTMEASCQKRKWKKESHPSQRRLPPNGSPSDPASAIRPGPSPTDHKFKQNAVKTLGRWP